MTGNQGQVRLTPSQKSVICSLDSQYRELGCSYMCADRLAKPSQSRPALVETEGRGLDRRYRLNDEGLIVRLHLSGDAS